MTGKRAVKGKIELDFSMWQTRDFRAFLEATKHEDARGMSEEMIKIITEYPKEGELSQDVLVNMPFPEFASLVAVIRDRSIRAMSNISPTKITVDLTSWTAGDYSDFMKALRESDFSKIDAFYSQVVKEWEFESDPTDADTYQNLAFLNHAAVVKGVQAQITRLFRGK